jgi:SSS family transporter
MTTAPLAFLLPASTHGQPAATRLSPIDLALVALYLIAITLFGLSFREKTSASGNPATAAAGKTLRSYFLANNTIPWWAIALSIVSAETSTLTVISIPGVAFAGDMGFLQVVIGYMLGRVVVALLFLPRYFQGEMLTAYQLIDQRFGPTLHKVTAGLFLFTRAAAEGVRVFAVSIVVGIAIGTRDVLSIAIISGLTLLYTFEGGMAAVIWTDVVQMALYIGGTAVAILTLGQHIPGGWHTIHTVAGAAGKFHWLNFSMNLTQSYTFWAGLLGGGFLTMASHGTDQLMVQRMLAARNLRQSQLALLSSGVVIFLQFFLFLLIGAGLFVFYGLHPTTFASADRIFPTFIVREMPVGVAGLLVAAILAAAMSNLSAALNSLSSTTVVDFYMHLRPAADARERSLISRGSTVFWAIVLFAVAVYSVHVGGKGHVVEIGLSIAAVAYGALLGVFLLGTLTRRATELGASIGMLVGFVLNVWLWQGTFPAHIGSLTIPKIAFTWYVLIGALVTFAVGYAVSLIQRRSTTTPDAGGGSTAARRAVVSTLLVIASLLLVSSRSAAERPAVPHVAAIASSDSQASPATSAAAGAGSAKKATATAPDFSTVSKLINDAIAQKKLPGAVVVIGHGGKMLFEQAYGDRKLAGEPGLDGKPSPAEPMTEDTIFDMASLSKVLSTSVAVMQLVEQGKLSLDAPVATYLPRFVSDAPPDPRRAQVTLRMLLTHTSGEAPDVDLKDPWGLAAPDKAEGIRRALATPLLNAPGTKFVYSDINFILLGHLVETISGESLDAYALDHIFKPLGMTHTRYLPYSKTCGFVSPSNIDAAHTYDPAASTLPRACDETYWSGKLIPQIAPTAHDDELNAQVNPNFGNLLRGTVDDPTTRRMGGVAGHAGVFSTAHDVSLYAEALLDKLLFDTGPFPLKQSTLREMTMPQQPSTVQPATILTRDPSKPTPTLLATQGTPLRGFGWDINTAFSRPRGAIFPTVTPSQPTSATPSFGHTGYTGTSIWIDPGTNTYVILLANAVHPHAGASISPLRGEVATAAAQALQLGQPSTQASGYQPFDCDGKPAGPYITAEQRAKNETFCATSGVICDNVLVCATGSTLATSQQHVEILIAAEAAKQSAAKTLTGIDALESTHYAALAAAATQHGGHLNLGLLTNQTGLDAQGRRTVDLLATDAPKYVPALRLTTLFSPEHGIFGAQDSVHPSTEIDPATRLPVTGLYGTHDADRRPSHEQLKSLDAVVIDLQDAGARFYTYETVTAYFLEAAAQEQALYHHDLEIIVLDRPDPVGGAVQGPVSDADLASYINYMPLPPRHGMTLGELARYMNAEATASAAAVEILSGTTSSTAADAQHATTAATPQRPSESAHSSSTNAATPDSSTNSDIPQQTKGLHAHLTVIPMQHWTHAEYYDQTGLPWIDPSPNLRSLTAATLYTGVALLETTNVSVGRGTAMPFEQIGAPYIDAQQLAAYLTGRHIPGVQFAPTTFTPTGTYPYHGETIPGLSIQLTDRQQLNAPELGIELLSALQHLYPAPEPAEETGSVAKLASTSSKPDRSAPPTTFNLAHAIRIVSSADTLAALARGDDPRAIAADWAPALAAFRERRTHYLLYP